jgi:cytoskeletal protein CcmA (bactofilin family)
MASKTRNNLPSADGSAEVTTTIAPGTRVVGRLSGQEDVRVHGTVEGTVRLGQTLFVEPEGVLLAEVYARDVVVSGTVVGNIHADNAVVLAASARVVGDIRAPRVSIEPGAALRGSISMDPFDADELEAEAAASRGYGGQRSAAAPAARGAISERAEPRRAAAPVRQQQAGVRLPPRRAQAFTAAPSRNPPSAPRAWAPAPPAYERDDDTIIVQHPAIRSDERPRRRTEALPVEAADDRSKKAARPKTLPRGKHKVERVD